MDKGAPETQNLTAKLEGFVSTWGPRPNSAIDIMYVKNVSWSHTTSSMWGIIQHMRHIPEVQFLSNELEDVHIVPCIDCWIIIIHHSHVEGLILQKKKAI